MSKEWLGEGQSEKPESIRTGALWIAVLALVWFLCGCAAPQGKYTAVTDNGTEVVRLYEDGKLKYFFPEDRVGAYLIKLLAGYSNDNERLKSELGTCQKKLKKRVW